MEWKGHLSLPFFTEEERRQNKRKKQKIIDIVETIAKLAIRRKKHNKDDMQHILKKLARFGTSIG
jgi:hypothetical protein